MNKINVTLQLPALDCGRGAGVKAATNPGSQQVNADDTIEELS